MNNNNQKQKQEPYFNRLIIYLFRFKINCLFKTSDEHS
jgi:hypothetical protein